MEICHRKYSAQIQQKQVRNEMMATCMSAICPLPQTSRSILALVFSPLSYVSYLDTNPPHSSQRPKSQPGFYVRWYLILIDHTLLSVPSSWCFSPLFRTLYLPCLCSASGCHLRRQAGFSSEEPEELILDRVGGTHWVCFTVPPDQEGDLHFQEIPRFPWMKKELQFPTMPKAHRCWDFQITWQIADRKPDSSTPRQRPLSWVLGWFPYLPHKKSAAIDRPCGFWACPVPEQSLSWNALSLGPVAPLCGMMRNSDALHTPRISNRDERCHSGLPCHSSEDSHR